VSDRVAIVLALGLLIVFIAVVFVGTVAIGRVCAA